MAVTNSPLMAGEQRSAFADWEKISEWAEEEVEIAASHGLVVGYDDKTFRPKNLANRAEAVTIIARALKIMD